MATTTCKNDAGPLYFTIADHPIGSDSLSLQSWGVQISIGTPPQKIAFRPGDGEYTAVAATSLCSSATDYDCLAFYGGTYDPSLSTSAVSSSFSQWNGSFPDGGDQSDYKFYNDVIHFGENDTSVSGYPLAIFDIYAASPLLGIGRGSAFLQAAVDSGVASSQSWGIWPGSRSFDNPIDGLLIIGAYDEARVDGEFSVFESRDDCSTCLQITDISWVDGTVTTSLFNDTTSVLQVGLTPYYETIQLPQELWETWKDLTGGTYDRVKESLIYNTSPFPNGELQVTIKNGYTVSIPPTELFSYPAIYDDTGAYTIYNETYKISMVTNYTNTDEDHNFLASWGLPFLTMNYLVVDDEEMKFRLAKAIRQDFGNSGGAFPKTLCTGKEEPTPTPTPTPPPPSPNNIGAIVGGAVGGVAVLLIIGFAIFFFRRRRNRRRAAATTTTAAAPGPTDYAQPSMSPAPTQFDPTKYPTTSTVGYPSPAFGHQQQNYAPVNMGYYNQPPPQQSFGYSHIPSTDYSQIQNYSQGAYFPAQASPPIDYRGASPGRYSDTTMVQELPSPPMVNSNSGAEWRGSEGTGSSELGTNKHYSANIMNPAEISGRPL